MCGICGVVRDDGGPVERESIVVMSRTMRHRGPDDHGVFVDGNVGLGHQRLSIIDLSAAGRQPMSTSDGRYWIVFNGEIYNYLELRQELEQAGVEFRSQGDTEVLLRLFEREGPECLQQLNGMFAFAIWDRVDRVLFAARDRFGIKPFYYRLGPGVFAFASEIKALVAIGGPSVEINHEALADYFTFQFCLGSKTLFRGIERLSPGHWLRLDAAGEMTIHKYWDLDYRIDVDHTAEYFHGRLRELLEDAVRLQVRADVPVGAHLSGGLDSSTIAGLTAARLEAPIHTFTGAFREGPQYDETRYARAVAKASGTIHHEVFPTADDFVEALPAIAFHLDEPVAGPGVFPQWFVSKLAARHVKVVLGGQGGDEIFGGYMRYLIAYLEECIRGGIAGTQEDDRYVVTFASILPNLPQLRGYEPLLQRFWQTGLFDAPERRYFRLVDRRSEITRWVAPDVLAGGRGYDVFDAFHAVFADGECRAFINRMTRFDLRTLLPALLQVEDRTSMAASLESRVPLLDHRIAELVASMPPKIKYAGGRSKHVFREVVRDLVPRAVFDRTDKMGFPVPLTEWYRCDPVRAFVRDTLTSQAARQRGWFAPGQLDALLDDERPFGRGVWGLLSLELWMQTYADAARRPAGCG